MAIRCLYILHLKKDRKTNKCKRFQQKSFLYEKKQCDDGYISPSQPINSGVTQGYVL